MSSSRRALVSRRRFLLSVGATAMTLPFLRAMPSYAAGEERRYLVLAFTPNGVIRHRWGGQETGPGPGEFTLKPFLAPLEAYKQKMIIIDGLRGKAAQGSHEAGMAALWTGVKSTGQLATGESIDQLVARECSPAGIPFKSIELRARPTDDYEGKGVTQRMIYSGANAPVDPREDPAAAFDALFGQITDPTDPVDPEVAKRKRLREMLFSHMDTELVALNPKLCSEDRIQLEALRENWNTLRTRFSTDIPTVAGCAPPDINAHPELAEFPRKSRLMMDILAMAIVCDLTRVLSIQWSQALSPAVFRWIGLEEDHHNLSHNQPQPWSLQDFESATPAEEAQHATIWGKLTDINVWYANEIAYLVKKLQDLPFSGTESFLDRTALCWGNELDNGSNHDHSNHPFVILGGCGGKLRTGQIVRLPKQAKNQAEPAGIRSHNDLLVSLARAMGSGITSFGDAEFNSGPLEQILL
jgi:hypothetical protein